MYLIKTPFLLSAFYANCVWKKPTTEKVIYLSFDDGPHPKATPFVLEQLKNFNAKASFFCIGKNVALYPSILEQIKREGHTIGNHTMHHLNGWKTDDEYYLNDIKVARTLLDTNFFRPPYGRVKKSQIKKIQADPFLPHQIIMWDVLSGDFDTKISGEQCLKNVLDNTEPGSIIVFHDSDKAWERMHFALPKVLAHFREQGYRFDAL